jgi:hypothetical protein
LPRVCSKDAAVEAEDGDLSAKDLRVVAGVLKRRSQRSTCRSFARLFVQRTI